MKSLVHSFLIIGHYLNEQKEGQKNYVLILDKNMLPSTLTATLKYLCITFSLVMESSSAGVFVRNIVIVPYCKEDINGKYKIPFSYEQILTCYKRLCNRKGHLTMKEGYSKERMAEILFCFVKLYNGFMFTLPSLKKYGFQYILPVDFKANVKCEIKEPLKELINEILDATNNNGCTDQYLIQKFVNTFNTEYEENIKECESTEETVETFTKSIISIFDKFPIDSLGSTVRKIPKFVGAEINISDNEIIYRMILNSLNKIKAKFFSSTNQHDITDLIHKIEKSVIHQSEIDWSTANQWYITSYFPGKKGSIPDSEYLKKFMIGVQLIVQCEALVYIPNKLVMGIVHVPNLILHKTIRVPSVLWLMNVTNLRGSAMGLSRKVCENLFESYKAIANLYLTGLFKEPETIYCEVHKLVFGKEVLECYVDKVIPKAELHAETKFFYN